MLRWKHCFLVRAIIKVLLSIIGVWNSLMLYSLEREPFVQKKEENGVGKNESCIFLLAYV